MNNTTKMAVIEDSLERRMGISRQKGSEYSGAGDRFTDDDVDTLANFKRNADKLGLHPVQILALYLNKHLDSYDTFIRRFGERTRDVGDLAALAKEGEGIVGRLDDIRNYVDLLECLLIDMGIIEQMFSPEQIMAVAAEKLRETTRDGGEHGDSQPAPFTGTPYSLRQRLACCDDCTDGCPLD